MRRLVFFASLFVVSLVAAQDPVGPISGGKKGVQSFTFQNGNGILGSVANSNSNVILSLQIANQAISLGQLVNISSGTIIGRKTAGSGVPELLSPSDILDLVGNTRGSILYRGASGWVILSPGANGSLFTSAGAGADPGWIADGNEKTVNKGAANGYASLDGASKLTASQIPASIELTANKGAVSGYAPLGADQKVPQVNLGSGSDGTGNHFLADDKAYHTLAGGGSVSNVSVVTANGVSGTVATSTTTPAITLSLGAITPTTIVASGAISGSNLSGTNTGDQTITLTGNVTGSGTGSFATTIANNAVTYAKFQQVNAFSLVGNPTNASANATNVTLDPGAFSFSAGVLRGFSASQSVAAYAIDVSTAKSFYKTLVTGTNTFTWSNFNDGDSIVVRCKQLHSGTPGTVAFPTLGTDGAHVTFWPGGAQPTQTATIDKSDLYQFHAQNGGDVYVSIQQNY